MIKNNFDDVFYPKNLDEILYKNVDEKMYDHIWRANKDFQGETAMTYFGERISYSELFTNIKEYAKALKTYGLQKGDCVTMAMPNVPETIYYIYACNLIGVTPYPIDPRCTFNYMLECIKNSNSKLFICEMSTYFSKVARYADKLPVENKVVVSPVNMFDDRKGISVKNKVANYLYEWKKFIESIKYSSYGKNGRVFQKEFISKGLNYEGRISEDYEPDIPAIIVNTSGTTGGVVKGTIHSNRSYNIYANQIPLITNQLVRGNTYYGYIPYFTMYGSCVGMHTGLTHGIKINNIPIFNGIKTMEDIIETKTNILIGTPNIIEKLTEMYEEKNIDANHVKVYVIGGDNVDPERLKKENEILLSRGMAEKIIFGYGATETMPISTTSLDERSQVSGSCGIPYPGVSIKIIDPYSMDELNHGCEGEVYVHTPNMMTGYLNMAEENEKVFITIDNKRFFKTGDKGYLTSNGILFLTGRYKRMMKRPDGHQTSPIPIENAIASHDSVKDCAVVGIKNNNGKIGVIPTAFIVLEKNVGDLSVDRCSEIVKDIAEHSLQNVSGERENALAYVITSSLPYTNNGKLDFKKLEEFTFDSLSKYYLIDDPVTRDYFVNYSDSDFIKLDKQTVRTLKK